MLGEKMEEYMLNELEKKNEELESLRKVVKHYELARSVVHELDKLLIAVCENCTYKEIHENDHMLEIYCKGKKIEGLTSFQETKLANYIRRSKKDD